MSKKPNIKIAIVDDHSPTQELLGELIHNLGYDYDIYQNGSGIIHACQELLPDIIILDVMLPGMDGFQICKTIKEQYGEKVFIIILTALDDCSSKQLGFAAGCDEFLSKPIITEELIVRVNNLVKIAQMRKQFNLREEIAQRICEEQCEVTNSLENDHRILVIEDSPQDQMLLKAFLDTEDYQIEFTASGLEAIEYLQSNNYDLVLLDYYLPDMTGLEVLQRLKDKLFKELLPIIMITANDDSPTKAQCIEIGVEDYLVKPVDRLQLKAKIKSLIKSHESRKRLMGKYSRAMEKASKDIMTGLYNNAFFKEFLNGEIISQKYQEPYTLLMMDLDDFKQYNDTNGHIAGDKALQDVASIILDKIRPSDLPVRYGGEEFAVVLVNTSLDEGYVIAEKIRETVQNHHFPGQENIPNASLTISIGVCEYQPDYSLTEFIQKTDQALYHAKGSGKNKVIARGEI